MISRICFLQVATRGILRSSFHLGNPRKSDDARSPMAAQADLASGGKARTIFETGERGGNCAQRSVLIWTIGPSFYGVQAMMFRSDPLVAHIPLPMMLGARCMPNVDPSLL